MKPKYLPTPRSSEWGDDDKSICSADTIKMDVTLEQKYLYASSRTS
ncbi:hypothetical protein MY3296_004201 [Beauveria thailandica]